MFNKHNLGDFMTAETIPLDAFLSSKMRKKFDQQEEFNLWAMAKIKLLVGDVDYLNSRVFQMQETINRLCKENAPNLT
jgi:hypothetical protein